MLLHRKELIMATIEETACFALVPKDESRHECCATSTSERLAADELGEVDVDAETGRLGERSDAVFLHRELATGDIVERLLVVLGWLCERRTW